MKGLGNQFVIILATLAIFTSTVAWGQNRRPANNNRQGTQAAIGQTQTQLIAAQKRLAAATAELVACQANLASIQGQLQGAAESSKSSRTEVGAIAQRLREIEQHVDESQPQDSAYALAKAAFLEAKETMDRDQARVFRSAEYLVKVQEASQGADKSEKLPKLKEQTLGSDRAYQRTRAQFDEAHSAYEREKHALLQKNDLWVAANKEAAAARSEQTKAEQKAQAQAMQKISANAKFREASQVAAAAQAKVQQLTSALHSLQRSIGKKPTTPGESRPPKGKK